MKLEDVDSSDELQPILSSDLYLPLDLLPPLEGNHFYFHEIIGFSIEDEFHGELGIIESVYSHPSQDLISMSYQNKEVLIPISEEIILSLNRERKIIHTSLPEGLLDIYLD